MLKRIMLSAVMAAAALLVAPATAALVTFTNTVDVSICNGQSVCNLSSGMTSRTFAVGDTVDYTVDFTGSQRLTFTDSDGGSEFFAFRLNNPSPSGEFTIANASVTLLGQVGTLLLPLTLGSHTAGVAYIGPDFFNEHVATGSSLSFTGYRVQYTIDALPANPTTYASNWLFLSSGLIGVSLDRPSVPAPQTLALLGGGLLALALARLSTLRPLGLA